MKSVSNVLRGNIAVLMALNEISVSYFEWSQIYIKSEKTSKFFCKLWKLQITRFLVGASWSETRLL